MPSQPPTPDLVARLENRLLEALGDLWDNVVDPAESLYDVDGSRWTPLGEATSTAAAGMAFTTEQQLREIRTQCRALAVSNEFAINGHENRFTNYTFPISGYFRGKPATQSGFRFESAVSWRARSGLDGGRRIELLVPGRQPSLQGGAAARHGEAGEAPGMGAKAEVKLSSEACSIFSGFGDQGQLRLDRGIELFASSEQLFLFCQ